MTSRPDHTLWRGVHVLLLLLVTVAGCTTASKAPDGRLTPLTIRPGEADTTDIEDQNDLMPNASPNGESVLFTSHRSGTFRLYVMNADGSNERAISSGPGTQMQGSWSPDGEKIVFIHRQDGNTSLAVMNADGSDPKILTEATTGNWPTAFWSPDGEHPLWRSSYQPRLPFQPWACS